jgi:hypothetical protein
LARHAAKGLTAVTPIRGRREDEKRISVFHISLFIKKKEEKLSAPNPFVNGFCHCHGVGKKRKKSRPFFFFSIFMLSPPRSLCMKEEERTRMV